MHALDALGLDETADEPAVKQAYAKRLRATRPDDDPVAFQQLHETYSAALAFVRWRQEHPETDTGVDDDDFDDLAATPSPKSAPQGAAQQPQYRPQLTIDAVIGEHDLDAGPFELDLDHFTTELFARAAAPDVASFRTWLDSTTLDWPLAIKPAIAHHVLRHMLENVSDIETGQLDAIVAAFGLDDVLTAIDPLGLEQLRQNVAARQEERWRATMSRRWMLSGDLQPSLQNASALKSHQERTAEMCRLLHPDNRAALCQYMSWTGRGAYPPHWTGLAAAILTSQQSYTWAMVLRPVPFATRAVMTFLQNLDEGRFDSLTAAIERKTLKFWEWAEERRVANKQRRTAAVIFFGVLAWGALQMPGPAPVPSPHAPREEGSRATDIQDEQEALRRWNAAHQLSNGPDKLAAIAAYDRIAVDYKDPQTPLIEQIVVVAAYSKGYAFSQMGKPDEARLAYEDLGRKFASSDVPIVRRWVANGLVNLGKLNFETGQRDAAFAVYNRVIAAYIGIPSEDLGLQVVKALLGKAEIFRDRGQKADAIETCKLMQTQISKWEATAKWQQPQIKALVIEASAFQKALQSPVE